MVASKGTNMCDSPQVHFVGQSINSGRLIQPRPTSGLPESPPPLYAPHTQPLQSPKGEGSRQDRCRTEPELSPGSLVKSFKKYCRNSLPMASFVVRRCSSGDVTLAICRSVACLSFSARNFLGHIRRLAGHSL